MIKMNVTFIYETGGGRKRVDAKVERMPKLGEKIELCIAIEEDKKYYAGIVKKISTDLTIYSEYGDCLESYNIYLS